MFGINLLWGAVLFPLDALPVVPEPSMVQLQMQFLKPGMDRDAVDRVLRFENRLDTYYGSLRQSDRHHTLDRGYDLMVSFAFDFQQDKWVFVSARQSGSRIASPIPLDAPAQNPKAGQFPSEPFRGLIRESRQSVHRPRQIRYRRKVTGK
jgi:hypothetical protein